MKRFCPGSPRNTLDLETHNPTYVIIKNKININIIEWPAGLISAICDLQLENTIFIINRILLYFPLLKWNETSIKVQDVKKANEIENKS
jgi:hypothetical protein